MNIPENHNKPKICIIAASEMTIKSFFITHIKYLSNSHNISVVVNTNGANLFHNNGLDVRVKQINIRRSISFWYDLIALIQLLRYFKRETFDIIHSVTPKAGMLAMVAGKIVHVPIRIHIFTGQVWVTRSGLSRSILKFADQIIVNLSTHILADSQSQKNFMINENVVPEEKITVLADGSISGVDIKRFRPDREARKKIRKQLGISTSDVVFLFIGRMKKDKGVLDLGLAFDQTFDSNNCVHLLFVGPDEEGLMKDIQSSQHHPDKIHFIPYTDSPEYYMAASDVLCLPSYREGFGSVIIEAAACGLPAIGSRIYGITDAIEEGKTGMTYEVGNVKELSELLYKFYSSPKLREEMGHNAHIRAEEMFSAERVTEAWIDYYQTIQ